MKTPNNFEAIGSNDLIEKDFTSGIGIWSSNTQAGSTQTTNTEQSDDLNTVPEYTQRHKTPHEYVQTPAEEAKQKHYEAEKVKSERLADYYKTLNKFCKIIGWVITAGLVILTVVWSYGVTRIAEPIGGITNSIEDIKSRQNRIEEDTQRNEDRLNQFIEKYLTKSR